MFSSTRKTNDVCNDYTVFDHAASSPYGSCNRWPHSLVGAIYHEQCHPGAFVLPALCWWRCVDFCQLAKPSPSRHHGLSDPATRARQAI